MRNAYLCVRYALSYLIRVIGQRPQSRSPFSMLLALIGRMERSVAAAFSIRFASLCENFVIPMPSGISPAFFMRLTSVVIHTPAPRTCSFL